MKEGRGLGAHVTLMRSAAKEREWKAYGVIPSGKDHWRRGQQWRLSHSLLTVPRDTNLVKNGLPV